MNIKFDKILDGLIETVIPYTSFFTFISSFMYMYLDDERWFSRWALGIVCLGLWGIYKKFK